MARTDDAVTVALIGVGSIGVSFAALYLKYSNANVRTFDPRPDLEDHVKSVLPVYLDSSDPAFKIDSLIAEGRLVICSSLRDACQNTAIVQEQGPENLPFKTSIWKQVVEIAPPDAHLWSSTSGIPASAQAADLPDSVKCRLLVVHPFNPPHIMPLLEIVPSPATLPKEVDFAKGFFQALDSGHQPVVVKKEVPGFVGNRLAFVLLREACHLVSDGVVSVEDLDKIVEASVGPRWAVTGPFKSYHFGGGTKGLGAFFQNLSGTIEDVWQSAGQESFEGTPFIDKQTSRSGESSTTPSWAEEVVNQTKNAYDMPTTADFAKRDQALKQLLQVRGVRTG